MKKWIKVEDLIDDILTEEIIVKEVKYFLKGTEEEILLRLKWDYNEHYYKTIEEKEGWEKRVIDKIITTNEDKMTIHVMSEEFSKEIKTK